MKLSPADKKKLYQLRERYISATENLYKTPRTFSANRTYISEFEAVTREFHDLSIFKRYNNLEKNIQDGCDIISLLKITYEMVQLRKLLKEANSILFDSKFTKSIRKISEVCFIVDWNFNITQSETTKTTYKPNFFQQEVESQYRQRYQLKFIDGTLLTWDNSISPEMKEVEHLFDEKIRELADNESLNRRIMSV